MHFSIDVCIIFMYNKSKLKVNDKSERGVIMKYFTAKNLQELRKEYKKLMVANHPDNGGDVATCQEITAEYKKLFDMLKAGQTPEEEKKNTFDYKADEALRNVINNIVSFDGLNIEVVGSWIWVDGNTYPYPRTVKEVRL